HPRGHKVPPDRKAGDGVRLIQRSVEGNGHYHGAIDVRPAQGQSSRRPVPRSFLFHAISARGTPGQGTLWQRPDREDLAATGLLPCNSSRDTRDLLTGDDPVDNTVLDGFLGGHVVVPLDVPLDLVPRLFRPLGHDLDDALSAF